MPSPSRTRIFAGDRVRDLRRRLGCSQSVLAARLGISVSYLSQIESGDRPITEGVLAALSRSFPLDWNDVSRDDSSALLVGALAAGTDPAVPAGLIDEQTVLRGLKQQPQVTMRMAALHAAFQRSQEQLRVLDDRVDATAANPSLLPWEEVRDWFQAVGNYVDAIDRWAEALATGLTAPGGLPAAFRDRLLERHDVRIEDVPADGASHHLRTFDDRTRTLFVDRAQAPETQAFQVAYQLVRLEGHGLIEEIARDAALRSGAARELLRVGLGNYGAGALLMPYGAFRTEARVCRHDIDRLRHRFQVSFEQACHRLSTLQRPAQQGLPFFFCRMDMAGNITKRHSATRLQFAQFGGACPLWNVHEAVAISDRILIQVAETPDGLRYVSMAKGLVKPTSSFRRPPRRYAVALGCEVEHAASFVYGDGLDLTRGGGATPIGPSCRICPRPDCEQRAFPPAGRDLLVDADRRDLVPYAFV